MEPTVDIVVITLWAIVSLAHVFPAWIPSARRHYVRVVAVAGLLIHAVSWMWAAAQSQFDVGFPGALSAMSLGVGFAYVVVASRQLGPIGLLLAPLSLVLLGTAQVVPHHTVAALADAGGTAWLPIHLGLVFAGLTGFALSSVVGVVYLWARARLKQKRLRGIARVPSLETLDRIQFRAQLFGFIFLTLGVGVGGAWAALTLDEPWAIDPKVWFTLLIWAWYAAALQVRLVAGRRGRWTALFSIVGFCGLSFSLVGLNFLLTGWHAYGG